MAKTYDPHVETLAEEFLSDEPWDTASLTLHRARVIQLSLTIQQAIEDWFEDNPYPREEGCALRGFVVGNSADGRSLRTRVGRAGEASATSHDHDA